MISRQHHHTGCLNQNGNIKTCSRAPPKTTKAPPPPSGVEALAQNKHHIQKWRKNNTLTEATNATKKNRKVSKKRRCLLGWRKREKVKEKTTEIQGPIKGPGLQHTVSQRVSAKHPNRAHHNTEPKAPPMPARGLSCFFPCVIIIITPLFHSPRGITGKPRMTNCCSS